MIIEHYETSIIRMMERKLANHECKYDINNS